MLTIWKFPLAILDKQTIIMPQGAKFMSVQMQNGVPAIWALVDSEAKKFPLTVHVLGTGNPVPQVVGECRFLGTIQQAGGALVWHVFSEVSLIKDLLQ